MAAQKWVEGSDDDHKELVVEWEASSICLTSDSVINYKVARVIYEKEMKEYNKAQDIDAQIKEEIE